MWILFILQLFLVISVDAQDDSNLLFRQVYEKNLALQSYKSAFESEEVRRGHLGRSFLPTVGLELGQERFQTGRYQERSGPYGFLEARFNLFRGGRDVLESKIRDGKASIAKYNQDIAAREELNKARKLYYQILYNSELLEIIEREKKDNDKILTQSNQRARSGVSTRTDSLEFKIYASELNETSETLNHENKILKIGIVPLLGLESPDELDVSNKLEHQHDDNLLAKKYQFQKHPGVALLDVESENFQRQKTSDSRWWTPSLDLYGGYYLYTLRDRDYLAVRERDDRVVGLRLSFELFDGLKGQNQASSNYYQSESKRIMARHSERQTESQFLILKESLIRNHEVMHYVLDRMDKSKDYLKLTLQEYDRGVKNSLDALVAMQRYYRYEKEYLQKKKEYQTIKADLLSVIGE